MNRLGTAFLFFVVACSSSGPAPIDPIAEAYCATCNPTESSCERVVSNAIEVACTEENGAYYACVTDSACDDTACEEQWAARTLCLRRAPVDRVQVAIALLAPSANLGHRGTGPTREGHPFPENSISSFVAAMEAGADGVSLDVEITQDGEPIVMHDDTVDRTTDCTGCVSELTLDEIRACRLLDGDGNPTDERPPTLLEVYTALGGTALIDLELKVFEPPCLTDTTGPEQLVPRVLDEVTRIGGESRTLFSSFDETAAELVKTQRPDYYSALLSLEETGPPLVEAALALNQDAIHPFFSVSAETAESALDEGLQVNVWTVNTEDLMRQQIEKGATAIITDDPGTLADLLNELRATE